MLLRVTKIMAKVLWISVSRIRSMSQMLRKLKSATLVVKTILFSHPVSGLHL